MRLTNNIVASDGSNRTELYSYDELNRLKTVNYGDGQTQGYSFDPMGNRTQKQDSVTGTENYSYNAANMLLSRAGNSYTNDADGNTLTGGGRTNTWDSENRMVSCVNGANTSSFVYGADGMRRRTIVNGVTTDSVLDNSMFIRERRNSMNIATYLVGGRGPEYRRDDANGQVRWYLYDGLGSVLGEVDPSGTVTSSRKYDVYGLVRGGNNPGGTSTHKFVGQLGHPSEDNTELTYMRARYYDPAVGRFLGQDPFAIGINWFIYASNNPVNRVDPTGNDDINELLYQAIRIFSGTDADSQEARAATFAAILLLMKALRQYISVQALASMRLMDLAEAEGAAQVPKDATQAEMEMEANKALQAVGVMHKARGAAATMALRQMSMLLNWLGDF